MRRARYEQCSAGGGLWRDRCGGGGGGDLLCTHSGQLSGYLHHPLLKHKRFSLVTHDRFFIVIETSDPKYSETETRKLLEAAGSTRIEWVEE